MLKTAVIKKYIITTILRPTNNVICFDFNLTFDRLSALILFGFSLNCLDFSKDVFPLLFKAPFLPVGITKARLCLFCILLNEPKLYAINDGLKPITKNKNKRSLNSYQHWDLLSACF